MAASLFVVPTLGVLLGVVLGAAALTADRRLGAQGDDLALGLTSTVESARTLLSTIAAATISFAGVAFSVSLLVIQLASNQYSPRIVRTMFRDPFTKRVLALVVGTFTYCLIVLRSVRSALDDAGEPVIPNVSVAISAVLGLAAILAIVAFIDHSAHAMDVSEVLERVTDEAIERIRATWREADPDPSRQLPAMAEVELHDPLIVRFERNGWIQHIDGDAIAACLPAGAIGRLETFAGRYAISGTPLCAISPAVDDADALAVRIRAAVVLGSTRTLQQDVSYGLRQLADVALRALSPGTNDPTTAQDAIFHAAVVLGELLTHDPPTTSITGRQEGTRLILAQHPDHAALVALAFDETRQAAAVHPQVCVYLLEAMHLLVERLTAEHLGIRAAAVVDQAQLVLRSAEHAGLPPADLSRVRQAWAERFATGPMP